MRMLPLHCTTGIFALVSVQINCMNVAENFAFTLSTTITRLLVRYFQVQICH